MSTETQRRQLRSAVAHPEPGARPTREVLEGMMIGLPSQLRGPEEVVVHLRLTTSFLRRWLAGPIMGIPAIPHFPMRDGVPVFNTAAVLTWLCQWFPAGAGEDSKRGMKGRVPAGALVGDAAAGGAPLHEGGAE